MLAHMSLHAVRFPLFLLDFSQTVFLLDHLLNTLRQLLGKHFVHILFDFSQMFANKVICTRLAWTLTRIRDVFARF